MIATIKRQGTEFTVCIYEPKHYDASMLECLNYFKSNNIYGIIYDHRGHGTRDASHIGHFDSIIDLVEDAKAAYKLLPKDKPRFILGHSMGSIVLRFLLKDIELDGAIIVGTGTKELILDKFIKMIAKISPYKRSTFINKLMFMGCDNHFKGNTKNRWLSANYANIYRYNQDSLSGNVMSNTVFKEISHSIFLVDKSKYISTYSKNAHYLFVSGKGDPFGHYGKDIAILRDRFIAEGLKAEAILYRGYRHEVLNEGARFEIYDMLIKWMKHKSLNKQPPK